MNIVILIFLGFLSVLGAEDITENYAVEKDCTVGEATTYRKVTKIFMTRKFEEMSPRHKVTEVTTQPLPDGQYEICVFYRKKTQEEIRVTPLSPEPPPAKPRPSRRIDLVMVDAVFLFNGRVLL